MNVVGRKASTMNVSVVPPSSGTLSPRGSERGDEAHQAKPYAPAKPTFCMGAYPEGLQEQDVRGDMLRSQTIINILAEALQIKDRRLLERSSRSDLARAKSSRVGLSPRGGDQEKEKDDDDEIGLTMDGKCGRRMAMIQRALKNDLEKELGKKVIFTRVPPTDTRLKKKLKVAGSELKILVVVLKNEPADCFDVEVKRVLVQFPDLVRLRLKEELNLESLDTSRDHKPKGNKSKTINLKHAEPGQNEICVEKWRDEWDAVEVTLKFERYEWVADRVDGDGKKGVYPRLLSIDVRFDIPRCFKRDHGDHGPINFTKCDTWTPPYQAGEKHSTVVTFWKERLLSELSAHNSGASLDYKKARMRTKMDELRRSAAAEFVVHSVLQAIEERGSQLKRKWRLESGMHPDPRLHAVHTDGEEHPYKHKINDNDMSRDRYHFVQMNVDRPVDEREAIQVWDMVMQLVSKYGDKTGDMRQELREKFNQLADPDNRLEQRANNTWPSREVPDPYVKLLLNQRRRFKDLDRDGRTTHTEGTLLYFAMRANVPDQVLDELLEQGADPEALQSILPLGTHLAVLRAPILYFAKDVGQVQTLIENDADTESKSCLNFFTHTTTLWTCCFEKNESVLDQLLNYHADPNTRGFHPDGPPLSGQEDRCTALEMAARMGMSQRAKELISRKAVFKVNLATTFCQAPPDVVREMALVGAVEDPKSLLTEDIVKSTHPSVLKTVYSEVAKSNNAVDKLRKQVTHMGSDSLFNFLVHLIREAPLAAGTFLDEVLLQTPLVQEKSRNPLPQTATIQEDDQMNVTYQSSKIWDFDYEVAGSMMPWQSAFIHQGNSASLKQAGASGTPCCNNAEFTEVKVLDVQSIVKYEVLFEMEMLSYQVRVDLFLQCTSLRALVAFTWKTWSMTVHRVDVACLVAQTLAILLWFATTLVDDSTGGSWASLEYTIIVCCWSVFTGTLLAGTVVEVPFVVSSLRSSKLRGTSSSLGLGSMEHINSFLKRAVFLVLNLCLSITSWNAWDNAWEGSPMNQYYRSFMAVVLYASYWLLMVELSKFHLLGQHLLPIFNAFSKMSMKVMLTVIALSWVSFMLWSIIEFHGDAGDGTVPLWQFAVESFLSVLVEVGESTFFPSEYGEFRFMYCHVVGVGTFVGVNIILMNIFIGICGECYADEKSRVNGSLVTSRLGICTRTIGQRRYFLGKFSTWFDIEATAVIQRTAAGFAAAFAALVIACIATGSWDAVPIVLAITVAGLVVLLKLFVILRNTKKKPPDAKPGQKWWIDHNYIWVCTPNTRNQVDDRQDEAQEHSRLFVVFSGGGLTATDMDGADRIIDITGMYKQDSRRNGRPQYFKFSPQQDDRSAPDIRIYWKEEFRGSGDLGQWELTIRDVSIDKYKKPTAEFLLKGCTSPFGQGLKQWTVVNEDEVTGHLFVMTSQDFCAYQHLFGTGDSGNVEEQNSCPTSQRGASKDPKVEAGGTERPGERESPPEWLRQLLVRAELDGGSVDSPADAEAYLISAAEWVRGAKVTESQLREDDEAREELVAAMGLEKYPARRLRQALSQEPRPPLKADQQGPEGPRPLDMVPPQVKRRIREQGLEDSDIDSVDRLNEVLTRLGLSLEESDVQALFEGATEEASGTLRLFGLLEYLYREEPTAQPPQVPPLDLA